MSFLQTVSVTPPQRAKETLKKNYRLPDPAATIDRRDFLGKR